MGPWRPASPSCAPPAAHTSSVQAPAGLGSASAAGARVSPAPGGAGGRRLSRAPAGRWVRLLMGWAGSRERGAASATLARPRCGRRAPVSRQAASSCCCSARLCPISTCWCALRLYKHRHYEQYKAYAHRQRLGGPQAVESRPRFLEPLSRCAPLLLSLASSIASACAINAANAPC